MPPADSGVAQNGQTESTAGGIAARRLRNDGSIENYSSAEPEELETEVTNE